jgi:riboflavin synthase
MADQQAAQAAQVAFMAALGRIGFAPVAQQEIIAYTGCANIAMLGLMTPEDISKICKVFRTHAVNPLQVMVVQEQLLLAVRFWVSNRQRLQKPVEAHVVTAVLAYNQAQMMRHMLEDEARADKEQTAKMPEKFKAPNGWRIFAEAMETYLI